MNVRLRILARKTHKWLGLFLGVQVVIWSLSGVYMTAVHIDTIHGDHLIRPPQPASIAASRLLDPLRLAQANGADAFRLAWVRNQPVYVLKAGAVETVVDGIDGGPIAPLSLSEVKKIARSTYTGVEAIASAELITRIPGEIRGRKPPLWRVEFDHWNKPTLYFSPTTGELLSRRHELWRIFDFVWMLHIMDYDERENVNNMLLRGFTLSAVLMALSGIWLLFFSFHRKKKRAAAE